jgi:hypothetical protein
MPGGGRHRCRRRRRSSPGTLSRPCPPGRERAKNLLWAAGKLADYAIALGRQAVPEVVLHPSVAERFTRCAPDLSGAPHAAHQLEVHRPAGGAAPLPGGLAAAPGTRQGSVCASGSRRLPGNGGRAAHGGAADAGRSAVAILTFPR